MAKLSLREQEQENGGDGKEEEEVGIYVEMKDLDDVLIKDVGDKLKESGKSCCVIDISKQASVFLRCASKQASKQAIMHACMHLPLLSLSLSLSLFR